MYFYLLQNRGFWGKTGFIIPYNNYSFAALDGGSRSFKIFNVLQLVCIVSNPSLSYFDTVDI